MPITCQCVPGIISSSNSGSHFGLLGMPDSTPITSETWGGLGTMARRANIITLRRMPVSKHSHSGTMPLLLHHLAKASILSTGLSKSIGGQAHSLFERSLR